VILDTIARVTALLFLVSACLYVARTAYRLSEMLPDQWPKKVTLTKEQRDIDEAVQVLTIIAVVFGLSALVFAIYLLWWLATAGKT
jgi:hypothetical protein